MSLFGVVCWLRVVLFCFGIDERKLAGVSGFASCVLFVIGRPFIVVGDVCFLAPVVLMVLLVGLFALVSCSVCGF